MKTVQVILERAETNYSAFIPELEGCVVTGATIQDIKENVNDTVAFHLEGMRDEQLKIPATFKGEYEFEYKLDVRSLFEWFSGILTKSGLARLTGMNQSLISQYANGNKKPSAKQTAKIQEAIHGFGEELLEVQL